MRLAGFGPVGNARLDREKVDAYRFTVVVPHDLRDTVEGAIEFRSLTCVDDGAPDDRCAVDSGHDDEARASCQKIDGVRFQTSKAYERVEWGYQSCCELCARPAVPLLRGGHDLRAAGARVPVLLPVRPRRVGKTALARRHAAGRRGVFCGGVLGRGRRSDQHNASFAAVANTCNLAEINTAALKVYNEDLEARATATEAPTAQTFEPTAAPESDAADRVALGAVAVTLLALVA